MLATSLMVGAVAETPEGDQALTEVLADLDIAINPRYGSVETDQAGRFSIVPVQYPWLVTEPPAGAPVAP